MASRVSSHHHKLPSYPPLHERIIGHRITAKKMTGASCQDGSTYRDRPSTYKGWDDLAMQEALTAVNRGMSVRRAALTHNVPKSTLSDRVTGKVIHGIKSGPQPYLSLSEEEELVSFLLGCAAIGYPRTRKDVIALVQDILISKGKSGVVTDGWWTGFKNRHCEITLRSAVPLSLARAKATDPAVIEKYYDLLENTLCENSLLDKPSQIFNCDETGIPLSPKSHRVIDHIGSKNPSYVTSDSKEQVTVLACVSASGYCMPPFVLFARRKLNPDLVRHEVPGTLYGMSSKGWMDLELFSEWFARHFLVHAPSARPLLLLMDGHSSHFCPDMIARAAAEKVILFTLPPNTTHLTQPLDKSGFSPLKSKWKEACHKFLIRKKGRTITIYDFSELFVEAWEDSMNMKTITSGFEVTGIYPFNRSAITQSEKYKMFNPSSLAVKSGLAYIPFYSPHPVRLKSSVTTQDSPVSSSTPLRSTFCHDSLIQSSHSLNRSYSSPALNSSNEAEADCLILSAHCLSKFLTLPSPNKVKSRDPKLSGRVLTSSENLAQMKELQMKKEREKREKEERKLLREQKAQQKRHEKEVMRLRKLHKRTGSNSSVQFSEEELSLFKKRFDNGYDLKHDERYNLWLHQKDSFTMDCRKCAVRGDQDTDSGKKLATRTVRTKKSSTMDDDTWKPTKSKKSAYDTRKPTRSKKSDDTQKSNQARKSDDVTQKPSCHKKASTMDDEIEEDKNCDVKSCKIHKSSEVSPLWIGCDCGRWFHTFCIGMKEIDNSFLCEYCKV